MKALPKPISVEMVRYAELRLCSEDRTIDGLPSRFDPPEQPEAPTLLEVPLEVEQVIDLIDRLVREVAVIKGYTRPEGAGPLSSTL